MALAGSRSTPEQICLPTTSQRKPNHSCFNHVEKGKEKGQFLGKQHKMGNSVYSINTIQCSNAEIFAKNIFPKSYHQAISL